jgi:hypothetical protein
MSAPQRALRSLVATTVLLGTALGHAPPVEASGGTCTTATAGSNTVQV